MVYDRSALLKKYGFEKEEEIEKVKGHYTKTGFPDTNTHFNVSLEMYDMSIEEPYFWVLESLKEYLPYIEKLEDSFAAAENSAFFGVTQQRLGAQQDKVSQFLATTGKMIKELFQMVRELRIIDERLTYYDEAEKELSKKMEERHKSSEITLKGMFVDLVQGGGKSAASVYGMSRELEFITLPDLFFDAPPFKDVPEMENWVNGLKKDFNQNVIRVLMRHLRQYTEWRKRTHQEHNNRRKFMLQYLLQHFEIIKMYIDWIKPYLRHVARLHMKEQNLSSPDIVSAFEASLLDVEILARQRTPLKVDGKEIGGANACVLVTFNFRTRPELKVVQEGYQRGPVHFGRFEANWRVYSWDDRELQQWRDMKQEEGLQLLGQVSSSVEAAMTALGDELNLYLAEARGVTIEKKRVSTEEKPKTLAKRFLGDFMDSRPKDAKKPDFSKKAKEDIAAQKKKAYDKMGKNIGSVCFYSYNNFKKSHRMIAW